MKMTKSGKQIEKLCLNFAFCGRMYDCRRCNRPLFWLWCSKRRDRDKLAGIMKEAGAFFGMHLAPWLMLTLAVIVPVVCIPIYRRAKKLVAAWDGEDEDISDTIDRKAVCRDMAHKRISYSPIF